MAHQEWERLNLGEYKQMIDDFFCDIEHGNRYFFGWHDVKIGIKIEVSTTFSHIFSWNIFEISL